MILLTWQKKLLQNLSQGFLHNVHEIPLPNTITGNNVEDLILENKLYKG